MQKSKIKSEPRPCGKPQGIRAVFDGSVSAPPTQRFFCRFHPCGKPQGFQRHSVKKLATLLVSCLLLFGASPVFAAKMFFEQEKVPGLKDQFKMGVFLETEEPLNAVEGTVRFPINLLELQNIEDGNSIVNLWLARPTAGKMGEIIFSGITPGGYQGSKGLIFSMTFLVSHEGTGAFEIQDARALRNDGEGTAVELQTFTSPFVVSQKTTDIQIPVSETHNNNPPESFTPEITHNASVFEDKWFMVFAAQDKDSSMDHYEVKESRQKFFAIFKNWLPAESPYVLDDQELRSYVFVKAVDKAGDKRIVRVAPRNPLPWYENYESWIIVTGGILVVLYAAKKL
ncbi:MAG: hypothetical protein A3J58_00715 [Candidatus Sungbacteria bacterium RIFCSPHIGHO2_02_FULL_52_23]|uniref:Cohesin domain-containing protein n=1 Tax=Candidatus Sungbacteria bacterium RIFCSPHIGHO2_02_FULL_52_23 TaxID=1802274 RepID=A0A1G2KWF8_9BACT|nr:MAG: hypothetical protein A3J58_00715 [Candidatus Sungbacteria bacterium RIFCSPHIGHO2_02_FULL_52_23]